MTRWRRPGADEILLVYLLLVAIGLAWSWRSGSVAPHYPPASFFIAAFLTWRTSRGGWLSRRLLIVGSGAFCVAAALAVARLPYLTVTALFIIGAAQVALLVSPPVHGRTRQPGPLQVRAPGWVRLIRRPPAWLLPWGLLAGVLVTLACLGHMDYVAVPGCRPAASDACTALSEGYPLRWLTAVEPNVPVISKEALLKDCVQWALVITSVMYLAWLGLTAPDEI